jgi:hypothetical protein
VVDCSGCSEDLLHLHKKKTACLVLHWHLLERHCLGRPLFLQPLISLLFKVIMVFSVLLDVININYSSYSFDVMRIV